MFPFFVLKFNVLLKTKMNKCHKKRRQLHVFSLQSVLLLKISYMNSIQNWWSFANYILFFCLKNFFLNVNSIFSDILLKFNFLLCGVKKKNFCSISSCNAKLACITWQISCNISLNVSLFEQKKKGNVRGVKKTSTIHI